MAIITKGIGSSDGIAIGKVFKLEETKLIIKNSKIKDVDSNILLLKENIQKTKKDLKKLEAAAKIKLGKEKSEIFAAHQQILEDPTIIDEIKEKLTNEKFNLAYCVNEVANKYFEQFKNMADPYFKERAADIKDVYNRLLKYILKMPVVDLSMIDKEVIIVANDLTPSQTSQLNPKFIKGFICNMGGRTSHAAIMARSLEIPAVLGLNNITSKLLNNDSVIVNGNTGEVYIKPDNAKVGAFKKMVIQEKAATALLKQYRNKPSLSKDNIKVMIEGNIGSVNDVDSVINNGGEGIGLFRSEFLYMDNSNFPTEEEQFLAYKTVLQKMKNKIVIIRTLDIGGDKHLSYFDFPNELNPFLGYRAIRLCLDKPTIFRTQLRALLRASAFGKLGIMFPMIATLEEFKKSKKILLEEKAKLIKSKIKVDLDVQIGMMIEIPTAALNAANFAKYSDFFSIGTNDLIQYTFAADRMSEKLTYLYQPYHPSILKLIKSTIDGAHKHNKWVGMCGEVAGDAKAIPLLLGLGLDAFSMSSTSILKARKIISSLNVNEMKEIVNKAIELETNDQVLELINKTIKF